MCRCAEGWTGDTCSDKIGINILFMILVPIKWMKTQNTKICWELIDLFYFLDADLECSAWPTDSASYGCWGDSDWITLDQAIFGTAECESLCRQHASKDGCCLVWDGFGCFWRDEANVADSEGGGLAIACKIKSKLF